jgi:hypothetical protein
MSYKIWTIWVCLSGTECGRLVLSRTSFVDPEGVLAEAHGKRTNWTMGLLPKFASPDALADLLGQRQREKSGLCDRGIVRIEQQN